MSIQENSPAWQYKDISIQGKDLVPISGYFNYRERNKEAKKLAPFQKRDMILYVYNISLGASLISGLIKGLQKIIEN